MVKTYDGRLLKNNDTFLNQWSKGGTAERRHVRFRVDCLVMVLATIIFLPHLPQFPYETRLYFFVFLRTFRQFTF
jgi:hypothetical protein